MLEFILFSLILGLFMVALVRASGGVSRRDVLTTCFFCPRDMHPRDVPYVKVVEGTAHAVCSECHAEIEREQERK